MHARGSRVIALDERLVELISAPVGASEFLDEVVFLLTTLDIVKAVLGVAVLLGAVRVATGGFLDERMTLLRALVATTISVFVVRVSQEVLPLRVRPVADATLDVPLSAALNEASLEALRTTSSFPSDHAAIMAALVTVTWLVHRRAGMWLGAWAVVGVLLPRVYLGIHFVGDIVVGALVGGGLSWVLMRLPMPRAVGRLHDGLAARPGLAAAVTFIALYEIGVLFIDGRILLDALGL